MGHSFSTDLVDTIAILPILLLARAELLHDVRTKPRKKKQ
jgi:hypothetical protein